MYYIFHDGVFGFYSYAMPGGNQVCIRVRIDSNPEKRAKEKGLGDYISYKESSSEEIIKWMRGHMDYPLVMILPKIVVDNIGIGGLKI